MCQTRATYTAGPHLQREPLYWQSKTKSKYKQIKHQYINLSEYQQNANMRQSLRRLHLQYFSTARGTKNAMQQQITKALEYPAIETDIIQHR